MKKFLLIVVAMMLILSVSVGLFACKKVEGSVISTDFDDVPEDAAIATGLSALTLFDQAIANTYAGDFKRVNTLDFYTDALLGQKQDEVASYYKVGETFMRTLVVKGEGSIAKNNTGIRVFYYDGETAKIAENVDRKVAIDFESPDYAQVANHVANCTDTEARLEDYNRFTSYVRTTDKLATNHNDQVLFKDNLYYATIKFNMNVGTVNSGIQEAIDRAVEEATGADANSINWTTDTVWNCIFIKIGDVFYLKKTYLYENYKGKQRGIINATCVQSHISEFSYGGEINLPTSLITMLGME